MIWFGLVSDISTIVGYLMPNPLYTYILNLYNLDQFFFFDVSTPVGYLMINSTIVGYLLPDTPYTYISNI